MILKSNNNKKIIYSLAKASLKSSKMKNVFVTITITLAICFIMVLGLSPLNYKNYERQMIKGMQDCLYSDVNEEQINYLKSDSNIKCVMEYRAGFEREVGNIKIKPIYYNYEVEGINVYKLSSGDFPVKANEIVIDKALTKEFGIEEKLGESIDILGEKFVVSGFIDNGTSMYYPLFFSKEYSGTGNLFKNSGLDALVKVKEDMKIPSSAFIKNFFYELGEKNGVARKNININNRFVDSFSINIMELETYIGLSVAVLVISGIVIYSIFYLSVSSKVKEYAQLRTIGMSKKQIKKLIKIEGLKYCKIAIPLGILIGTMISYFVSKNGFSIWNVLKLSVVSIILGVITVLIAVSKPAKMASKISPVEGLRYTGNDEKIKSSNKLCRNLNPNSLGKIQFKRNQKRTIITLISLIIGGILFIGSLTFANSLDYEKFARNGYFDDNEYLITFSNEAISDSKNGMFDLIENGNNLTKLKSELEELEEIEKINTKNSYTVKIEAHNEIIDDEISPISKDIEEAMIKSLENGTGNYEELKNKGEIYIAYNDVFEEIFGYRFKVGDKIKLHYFNGKENSMELTVGGVGNSSFSKYGETQGWILLPDDIYEEITQNLDTTMSLKVTTQNHIYNDEIDNKVKDLVREYEEIDCETFSQWREQAIKNSKSFSNILIGISIFVILFSLINLMNTVIISMVTRKREIAVLQSMGMTKKQVNKMIIFENVCLAIPNCLVSSIVGPIVVFIIMKIMQETGIKYLFFKVPVMGIVLYLIISIVIPSIIAIFCIKEFNKESIVERLREN